VAEQALRCKKKEKERVDIEGGKVKSPPPFPILKEKVNFSYLKGGNIFGGK